MHCIDSALRGTPSCRLPTRSLPSIRVQAAQQGRTPSLPDPKRNPGSTSERVLETVEVAALALAVGGHFALVASTTSSSPSSSPGKPRRAEPLPSAHATITSSPLHSIWVTGPLLVALLARSFASRLSKRRAESTPTAQAMARLLAVESALASQAESMAEMARHIDKLQIRTRLTSRDVWDQLKQTQAASTAQGEALLGAGGKLQQLEDDVRAVEDLVGGVQGLAAKQFTLLLSVIDQQKRMQSTSSSSSTTSTSSSVGGVKKTVRAAVSSSSSSPSPSPPQIEKKKESNSNTSSVSAAAPPIAAPSPSTHDTISSDGTDEWGRSVKVQAVQQEETWETKKVEENKNSNDDEEGEEKQNSNVKLNDDGSVSFSF